MIRKPVKGEYPEYFKRYIDLVPGGNVLQLFEKQRKQFLDLLEKDELLEKADFSYQNDKWITKELIGHIIDTERVLSYRSFFIARGDQQILPGFEQDDYVLNSNFKERDIPGLAEEFNLLRLNSIHFFKTLPEERLMVSGNINGFQTILCAMPYIMLGHVDHHISILLKRYL